MHRLVDAAPTDGTTEPVLQRKRKYRELANIGPGEAGQWHQGNNANFHVTIYPDNAAFIVPHGFAFISTRWTSEFHVTDHGINPHPPRRFYNMDTGAALGAHDQNLGANGARLDGLAAAFMAAQNAQVYTDPQALLDEAAHVAAQAAAAAAVAQQRLTAIRAAADLEAAARNHVQPNWASPASAVVIGAVRRRIPQAIAPSNVEIQQAYDAAIAAHNAAAAQLAAQNQPVAPPQAAAAAGP